MLSLTQGVAVKNFHFRRFSPQRKKKTIYKYFLIVQHNTLIRLLNLHRKNIHLKLEKERKCETKQSVTVFFSLVISFLFKLKFKSRIFETIIHS